LNDVAREIASLNGLIQKLQVSYDQYFAGALRREPLEMVREAEGIIDSLGRGRVENPVMRYRFNGLVARYNSFKSVWERKKREREGAAPHRVYGLKTEPGEEESFSYIIEAGKLNDKQAREIFDHYKRLRRHCGEPVEKIRFENFKASLSDHILRIFREAEGGAVLVKLDIHQSKARISARLYHK
jgi:hypothetical protein